MDNEKILPDPNESPCHYQRDAKNVDPDYDQE